jgi:predicted glutamine amidotransferase
MCGIFGAVIAGESRLRDAGRFASSVECLFLLSESRGKEAAGIAITNDEALAVYKAAQPAREMIRARGYRSFVAEAASDAHANGVAFIGHSRLVTDGDREVNRNNQPVLARGVVGIHNGIIVNHAALWARHDHLKRQYEVDSEVIFALVRDHLDRGAALDEAARRTFAELEGAASIAALFDDRDQLLLATNNGSLYYRCAPASATFVFASESYIMDQFAARHAALLGASETVHVRPGEGAIIDLGNLSIERFSLTGGGVPHAAGPARAVRRTLVDRAVADPPPAPPPRSAQPVDLAQLQARFPYVSMRDRLRRCTRCVLPETMPFVDFDADGVCSYCRRHVPLKVRGSEALEEIVAPHRRGDGRPDCIVGVSGGRDSIYGLHYIKTVLGMNPVAYTYDWGMVTDLARRNVSRICGKLGIEHILVSADIPQKREWIRKNVEAWLAKPSLGTIPLFMAGDKAYFYYLTKAREQLGVELSFLCENLLERTDFKTGFAGVPPIVHDEDHAYTLPLRYKAKLASFYGTQFLTNPRYLNTSLLDTAKAFAFYYLIKRDFHNLYRYAEWDEEHISSTLIGTYDFELADDTKSTWRIGDGTASFYNYIYYAVAGLTENDTFRSNQIRNGAISRERALELIDRDNRPRFPSIQWYLKTIGMERTLEEVIEIIERIPKLWR